MWQIKERRGIYISLHWLVEHLFIEYSCFFSLFSPVSITIHTKWWLFSEIKLVLMFISVIKSYLEFRGRCIKLYVLDPVPWLSNWEESKSLSIYFLKWSLPCLGEHIKESLTREVDMKKDEIFLGAEVLYLPIVYTHNIDEDPCIRN